MDLEEIYQAILAEINSLIVLSKRSDVGFERYKPLYDMLIALKQAQALESIQITLDEIRSNTLESADKLDQMASLLHSISEK